MPTKTGLEWAKKTAMAFNTILCLMGVAVGVVGLSFMLNEGRPELTQKDLLWGSLGVALVLVLTGVLGMVFCCGQTAIMDVSSAMNSSASASSSNNQQQMGNISKQRSAFKCYIILAFLLAVAMGGALRYTSVLLRPEAMRQHLSKLWDRVPDETALAIETMGECCGFASYRDRIQEPCLRRQQERGCATTMIKYYRKSTMRMVPIMWTVLVSCIIAVLSGLALWIWGERTVEYESPVGTMDNSKDNPVVDGNMYNIPGTPKGQSFDDWHRTIFQ